MYKVIMAPTEGSDSERAALTVAVKLAQRFDPAYTSFAADGATRHRNSPTPASAPDHRRNAAGRAPCPLTQAGGAGNRMPRTREHQGRDRARRRPGGAYASRLCQEIQSRSDIDVESLPRRSEEDHTRQRHGLSHRNTKIPVLVVKPPASFIGGTPRRHSTGLSFHRWLGAGAENILPEVGGACFAPEFDGEPAPFLPR